MTALDRAIAWFLEPPAPDPPAGPARAGTPAGGATPAAPGEPDAARDRAQTTWLRPLADPFDLPAVLPPDGRAVAPAALDDPPPAAGPTLGGRGAASASLDELPLAGRGFAARRPIGCAAVLGRPGHAEPVAAALALALSAGAQARAATVVVLGPADHLPRGHADRSATGRRRAAGRGPLDGSPLGSTRTAFPYGRAAGSSGSTRRARAVRQPRGALHWSVLPRCSR